MIPEFPGSVTVYILASKPTSRDAAPSGGSETMPPPMTDTKQTLAIADATAAPRSGRRPAAQDSGPSDTPVRNGHLIGYARVFTRAPDLALQLDALEHDGCERVYQDVGSGSIRSGRGSTPARSSCCPAIRSWSGAWTASGAACAT